jgi:endonuclease YncB( thermonuclease family)
MFSLTSKSFDAKVIDVYDGDTITLAFEFGREVFQKRCRVKGVDCAEIRTRNKAEKATGLAAKARTTELVLGKIVRAVCDGNEDKYGRLLAEIYVLGVGRLDCILIREGLGYAYHGEHKTKYEEWNPHPRQ